MTTTFESNQYTNQISLLKDGSPSKMFCKFFEGVTATADTGTLNFVKLPPGKLRILPGMSGFISANMAENANIAIGTAAYTASNRATVAAVTDALLAAALVNTCTLANSKKIMTSPANAGLELDTLDGVVITGTVTDADTVANATYSGWITYAYFG